MPPRRKADNSPVTQADRGAELLLRERIVQTFATDAVLREKFGSQRGAMGAFERLQGLAYVTRTWSDGYGYLLVATGRADAMVDPVMNLWDAAAIKPVLEEAGGPFTDWQGRATIHHGEGVATNRRILDEVLAITREFPRAT